MENNLTDIKNQLLYLRKNVNNISAEQGMPVLLQALIDLVNYLELEEKLNVVE